MLEREKFIFARDFLLQHREDYMTAVRDFVWPRLTHFNWALDYFGQTESAKFDSVTGDFSRIAVGFSQPDWMQYEDGYQCSDILSDAFHQSDAPLLRYFTSGTTSQPKLVEHSHVSYPVGHLSTMYWIGLRPGDIHLGRRVSKDRFVTTVASFFACSS